MKPCNYNYSYEITNTGWKDKCPGLQDRALIMKGNLAIPEAFPIHFLTFPRTWKCCPISKLIYRFSSSENVVVALNGIK